MSIVTKFRRLIRRAQLAFGFEPTPESVVELAQVAKEQGAPPTRAQVNAAAKGAIRSGEVPLAVRSNRAHRYGLRKYTWGVL